MSEGVATNPFQRGRGSYPPVLAGRQAELSALGRIVDGLADGSLKQTIHLIQAPRGLGKTVLVQAMEIAAAQRPQGVEVLRVSAGNLPSLDALAKQVEPATPVWRKPLEWFRSISLFGARIQRPASEADDSGGLELALARRAERPLVVAIDEAHVLPADACRALLNIFQNLAGKARCALLLIGTPALKPLLLSEEVNASFAERAPVLTPALLSPQDSLLALRVPQWREWTLDEEVLSEVVAESLGYPFFVQLWGDQLWEAGCLRKAVDRETLAIARKGVEVVRADFYAARIDEFERFASRHGIDRDALLSAVQRIAPHVGTPDAAITTGDLNATLGEAGLTTDQATLAKQCFIDNGLLTRSGDDWEAAIPSLATYISKHPR